MRGITLLLVAATVARVSCVDVWWESAVVYQIYPRSFMDSNGDGVGDLNGIKSKLPYLAATGVDAIWLSPIYKSPMRDFGYDITDYRAIAPEFGTMEDFDALVTEANKLGVRVVLDFVPNHTSPESDWFVKSINRTGNYTDYYVWANGTNNPDDPSNPFPPNNWISMFRKSAWEYVKERGQFYLHQFVIGQPDLNYRNPVLQEEMKNVLRFWLDKGVSGFRVDAINMLFEVDPELHGGIYPDEPPSNDTTAGPEDYGYLNHIYTRDQNETYDVVYDWREVLDQYNESKIMLTEGYTTLELMMRYYGNADRDGSIPFNFVYLGEMTSTSTATEMKTIVDKWMSNMPSGKVANWVNGNHDQSRMSTRYGVNRIDAMNMLVLILPGVSITYQGEEIGMTDGFISWADTQDPQACNTDDPINYWKVSRDVARTPFHWDNSTNAGFSTHTSTWLPVASNYETVNLAAQQAATKSHYNVNQFYKDVVALKHTPAVSTGELGTHALSDDILVVTRSASNNSAIVGIINLSSTTTTVDLSSISWMTQRLQVEASGISCIANKGAAVQKNAVSVAGNCAMALRTISDSAGNDTTVNPTDPVQPQPGSANRFVASFTVYSIVFFIYGYLQ